MRVLHVIDTAGRRGAETFASDLIATLKGAGVSQEVTLVHGKEPHSTEFHVPVRRLASNGWTTLGLHLDLRTVRDLRDYLRRWDPDVIQSHGGDSVKYTSLSASGLQIPVIVRAIGTVPTKIRRGAGRLVYRRFYRGAAAIVAVAETVRSEIVSIFAVPPERVRTIPNAVDASRMQPTKSREEIRAALGVARDAPVIVSIGALTWEKDPLAHIEIGHRVGLRVPGAVHLFVGDGPLRSEVEAAVRRRGSENKMRLLGMRSDVAEILAASDVLLFASRPDGMEGVPAVVIEAGMAGLPVVGYRIAGVHEVVLDGLTGVLLSPGDVDGIVGSVTALLTDHGRRRRLGEAGRQRCLAEFEIGAAARRYLELYERCLADRRSGAPQRRQPRS